jgi:2-amino-4-hydroxy-6-hydroxymethyldihydropteridine diphosphokinase
MGRGRSTSTCCCSATSSSSERLSLPHPEITSRRFVLEPLLELDPELALPDGTRLAERLDAVRDQPVRPAGPL